MPKRFLIIVIGLFLLFPLLGRAVDSNQQILQLRAQIEELQKKANEYRKIVATSQSQAASLKRDIDSLNNRILALQTQVQITEKQISSTQIGITQSRDQIYEKQQSIDSKGIAIANLLSLVAERDQEDLLSSLIKNTSLSQFLDELESANKLNESLLANVTVLRVDKESLEKAKTELEEKKQELESLHNAQKRTQVSLSSTKQTKGDLLTKTKGKEETYQKLLADTQAAQDKFFNELKRLEASAVTNHEVILHVTASYVPPKGTKLLAYPHESYYVTQGYGYTAYAKRGAYNGSPHNGVDISGGCGTPITSVASGEVLVTGTNGGYGNWIAVKHQNGLVTIYAHMKAPSGLANGTPVTTSSVIGYEGSTGNSTGCHVHLVLYRDFFTYPSKKTGELYFNYFDGTLNPLDYLDKSL